MTTIIRYDAACKAMAEEKGIEVMPYVRIDPELFLEHAGVEVFHTYDAGWSEPCDYWFTTNPDNADEFCGHGREGQFDARLFARICEGTPNVGIWEEWWKPRFQTEEDAMDALIKTEIDEGRLKVANTGAACKAMGA